MNEGSGADRGGRRSMVRRRGCEFCRAHIHTPDYKDVDMLRRYISDRGKLEARRRGGTCARHQRSVSSAIKRARHMALLPYTAEHTQVSGVAAGRSMGGRR